MKYLRYEILDCYREFYLPIVMPNIMSPVKVRQTLYEYVVGNSSIDDIEITIFEYRNIAIEKYLSNKLNYRESLVLAKHINWTTKILRVIDRVSDFDFMFPEIS